jgi:hypothetical protein
MLVGQCYVCGAPAMLGCPLCGRTVCKRHLDAEGRLCRPCRRKMMAERLQEEE